MYEFPPPSGDPSSFNTEPTTTMTWHNEPDVVQPTPPPKRSGGWKAVVAGGVAGAILGGGVAFATVKATEDDAPVRPAAAVAQPNASTPEGSTPTTAAPGGGTVPPAVSGNGTTFDIQAVLAKVSPSVVAIETGQAAQNGIFPVGAGSGVVISADGLIITNNHVIESADAITVKVNGEEYEADLIGSEPSRDIALVKVRGDVALTPATLGDTDNLKVGDTVVAIGNALNLGDTPTVTVGIVSAKGRSVETDTETLQDLIQTDAAINPGNSGGALVNVAGELVGINTAGIRNAQNISFAIDINGVKSVIEELKAGNGSVTAQPFLGVSSVAVADLTAADREQFSVTATSGVLVTSVQSGSGADLAGLEVGDVLVSIDGNTIEGADQVREAILAKQPNESISIVLERDGQQQTVTATLGSRVPR